MQNHILNYIRLSDFCTLMYLLYHCATKSMKEGSYLETKEIGSESVHYIHLPMFLLE